MTTTDDQLLDAEEDARACLAAAAALESVEAELAAAHEAVALHREVTRHQAEEIARLSLARDRALACEAAALGLLPSLRARLAESEWLKCCDAPGPVIGCDCRRCMEASTRAAVLAKYATEARLSAATRVVEAAGALEARGKPTGGGGVWVFLGDWETFSAALREWKEGSGT